MAFRGATFDNQLVKSKYDAGMYAQIFGDGPLWGCEVSASGTNINISQGQVICAGRIIPNEGIHTVALNSVGDGYVRVKLRIDLNGVATATEFDQISTPYDFSYTQQFPELVQEDINDTGRVYEMEIGVFQTSGGQVSSTIKIMGRPGINLYIPLTGSTSLSGVFSPSADNTGQLGGSTRRWGQVFARSFVGDLAGTASTATKWNILTYIPTPSAALDYFLMIEAGTGRALPVPKANFIPVSGATNLAGTFAPATANTARVGTPEKPFYQMNAQTFVGSLTGIASGNVPLTGSTSLSGVFSPSADNTGQLGGSTRRWGQVFARSFVGDLAGTASTATTAAMATKLAAARKINGVAFDGSADITVVDQTARNTANAAMPKTGGTFSGSISLSSPNPSAADSVISNDNGYFTVSSLQAVFTYSYGGYASVVGGAYTNASSKRFKSDIRPLGLDAAEKILKMLPVTFHPNVRRDTEREEPRDGDAWSAFERLRKISNAVGADIGGELVCEAEQLSYGLIAEDVAKIDPTYVTFDDVGDPIGINYSGMIPAMLKLLQEQDAKLKQQSAKIDDLETRLAALEERMTT